MKATTPNLFTGALAAFLVLAVPTHEYGQEYTFLTLAGPVEAGPGAIDGPGPTARFSGPSRVAVDSAGNLYVVEAQNCTVRKVTPAGVVSTLAGLAENLGSADGPGSAARFDQPYGVAVDSAGNVYVADTGNCSIRKVTPAGVVTTLAGLAGNAGSNDGPGSAAQFQLPWGVAVDSAGNLYVADFNNSAIRKVTPAAVVTTLAGQASSLPGSADGTGSAAQFFHPYGVAVDSVGNLYVAEYLNDTIRKVSPAAVVTTLAGNASITAQPGWPIGGYADGTGIAARFNGPEGVAVDSAGNVYVADTDNSTIRKVTPGGAVTTVAGLAGTWGSADGTGSQARFARPTDVAVDRVGNLYVADSVNETIRKVSPPGVVTTLAGQAGTAGSADGTGNAALFNWPSGLAMDSAGTLYVADSLNNAIRKVAPNGLVSTLAGGFPSPQRVAVDSAGNVYVANADGTIRNVTPDGVVMTLAGSAGNYGTTDGTGGDARFSGPEGLTLDTAGNLYVADGDYTIRVGRVACPDVPTIDLATGPVGQSRQLDTSPQTAVAWRWSFIRYPAASSAALSAVNVRDPTFTPDVADLYVFRLHATNAAGAICIRTLAFTALPTPPAIVSPPPTQTAEAGGYAVFSVEATNLAPAVTCQWYSNCTQAIAGATNSFLVLGNVQPAQAGAYDVVVTDPYGSVTSDLAALSMIPPVTRRVVPAPALTSGLGGVPQFDYRNAFAPGAQWLSISNLTLASTPQFIFDLSDPLPPQRFYRAWRAIGPPPVAVLSMATEIPLAGAIGGSVHIDYINAIGPTNAWVTQDTVLLTNSPQLYFDTTAFRQPTRLYRLVPVP